jgi:hypothetical protein
MHTSEAVDQKEDLVMLPYKLVHIDCFETRNPRHRDVWRGEA